MVDGKQLAAAGFAYIGRSYEEMDCQAFVERCLADCGLKKDLRGSNAWYREVYNNGVIMTPEECVKQLGTVPPGAFLFILEQDGGEEKVGYHDGLGNASHIGLVTGKGEGAIHSSKSRGGVCESKFRNKTINGGWNRVGLYDKVSYDYGGGTVPDPEPAPAPEPAKQYAAVWSENDLPVNTRTGPGKSYPQSKAGKLAVGEVVEILKTSGDWCWIRCRDKSGAVWTCWMMAQFLKPVSSWDEVPNDELPEEPDDDFTPGDTDAGGDDHVTLYLNVSQEEAVVLLQIVDRLQWNLVKIVGERG